VTKWFFHSPLSQKSAGTACCKAFVKKRDITQGGVKLTSHASSSRLTTLNDP
jgi:hypothetical protein